MYAPGGIMPRAPVSRSPTATTPRSELSSVKSEGDLRSKASQQKLDAALQDLELKSSTIGLTATQSNPTLFTSPCLFHRRFDDAINLQKVLEEIAGDEGMSHSRLVLTATGVREIAKQLQRKPIKTAVRNIMIITKARDNNLVTLTRELAEWLLTTPRYGSAVGVNVYVDEKLRQSKRFDATGLVAQNPRFETMLRYWTPHLCWSSPQQFDLVLTLGGDGTVLFTSWLFQRIVPPVLSFSLGSLGFLTPFDFANHREHLNRVMGGIGNGSIPPSPQVDAALMSPPSSVTSSSTPAESGMRISLRMRFTCTVYRAVRNTHRSPTPTAGTSSPSIFPLRPALFEDPTQPPTPSSDVPQPEQFEVLNELVIDRGPSPYVSLLHLYGDSHPLTTIQADGLILSTPTGSTAYSLSAGGSLVHPDIPAILLTPICPHTLSFRPMLLNDTMLLTVKVPGSSRANAWCSFDGKGRVELRHGDSVDIKASRYPFPTVIGAPRDQWVDSISRTLRWNTRGVRQRGWGAAGGGAGAGGNGGSARRSAVPSAEDAFDGAPLEDGDERRGRAANGYGDLGDGEGDEDGELEGGLDGDAEGFDIDFDDEDAVDTPLDSGFSPEGSSERSRGAAGSGGGHETGVPLRGSLPFLSQLNI